MTQQNLKEKNVNLFAGTSTKYDYLSTYTNIGKYETKYNTSSSYAKVMATA